MKTMEERIKEIKNCADCAIYTMDNHKLPWLPDDGSFDEIINIMHIAQNKNKLSEAYYTYINLCINHGYSDGEIIAGIMQNDAKNKEFNVNIDSVIKSLIEIKYTTVKLCEPVIEQNNSATGSSTSAGGIKVSNKSIDKIKKKINYMNSLVDKLLKNESKDPTTDLNNVESIANEIKQMISVIDPTSCNAEVIAELNDYNAMVINAVKKAKEHPINNTQVISTNATSVEQPVAAHNEGAFNIGNFIKPNQQPVKGPNVSSANKNKPTAFPHEICGLTDDQIVEKLGKHFKVLETIPAYPLYDLINNKLLAKKMKELDAKQRPNNPYLTQVNINDYIDVPELLEKYTLCFTMPCNDKKQIIVILFNPNPELDKNGMLRYPLHIFKATKNNNK